MANQERVAAIVGGVKAISCCCCCCCAGSELVAAADCVDDGSGSCCCASPELVAAAKQQEGRYLTTGLPSCTLYIQSCVLLPWQFVNILLLYSLCGGKLSYIIVSESCLYNDNLWFQDGMKEFSRVV